MSAQVQFRVPMDPEAALDHVVGHYAAWFGATGFQPTTSTKSSVTFQKTKIPAWAIAIAVIFFWTLIALLFLLAKEHQSVTFRVSPDPIGALVSIDVVGGHVYYWRQQPEIWEGLLVSATAPS